MVLETQPKGRNKRAWRNRDPARPTGHCRAAEPRREARLRHSPGQSASRPLPGRHFPAALAIPLPSPSPPQNVRGGARRSRKSKPRRKGQTRPGSPSHPRAAPRPPPSAPRPVARPRSLRGRAEGERAPGRRDGCDPFLPPLSGDSPALTAPSGRHPAPGRAPLGGRAPPPAPPPPSPLRSPTEPGPVLARTAPREPGTPPRAPRSQGSRDPRGGESPRTGRRRGPRGGDGTMGDQLPRGASGPALTSASPPGRWQHCAGSPRLPDRGTRLTSARRERRVGCPRKRAGPRGETKLSGWRRGLSSFPPPDPGLARYRARADQHGSLVRC